MILEKQKYKVFSSTFVGISTTAWVDYTNHADDVEPFAGSPIRAAVHNISLNCLQVQCMLSSGSCEDITE